MLFKYLTASFLYMSEVESQRPRQRRRRRRRQQLLSRVILFRSRFYDNADERVPEVLYTYVVFHYYLNIW